MKHLCKGIVGLITFLGVIDLVAAQARPDERAIADLVEVFRLAAFDGTRAEQLRPLLAEDYVHITPDGAMTTAWRLAMPTDPNSAIAIQDMHVRVFGDVGVAAYMWHANDQNQPTSVMQVFQRRARLWRIVATQVGGRSPSFSGPITATSPRPPRNTKSAEDEIHAAWNRFMDAVNLRTPKGERAEDIDTVRSIFAEDAIYVDPSGNASTREERLALGHGVALRLSGDQKVGTVVVRGAYVPDHVDRYLAIFGNAAVWTSRNPANSDQSVRVWLKRPAGWQMVAMHHGMSYVRR